MADAMSMVGLTFHLAGHGHIWSRWHDPANARQYTLFILCDNTSTYRSSKLTLVPKLGKHVETFVTTTCESLQSFHAGA